MFKVNNKDIKTILKTCLMLTIKKDAIHIVRTSVIFFLTHFSPMFHF